MTAQRNFIKLIEPDSCRFTEQLYEISHIHSCFEFIFCISGEAEAIINNRSHTLKAGKGVFVLPNQIHLYKNISRGEFCVIVFKPELIPEMRTRFESEFPTKQIFSFLEDAEINSLLNNLKSKFDQDDRIAFTLLTGYINLLLYAVYPKLSVAEISREDSNLLYGIIEYCFLNFRKPLSVGDIARHLLTNTNRVSRVFNSSMNMGIPQYVEFLRLSAACDLLKNSSKSVLDISEEVGFGSIRSFNRAFTKTFNSTPKEFRASKQEYKFEISAF